MGKVLSLPMSSTLSKHISVLHLVIGRGPRNKGNEGNGVRYTISRLCKPCKLRDIPWYSPYQNWWPYSRFLLPTVQYRNSCRHRVSKIWGRQVTMTSLWSFKVPCGDTVWGPVYFQGWTVKLPGSSIKLAFNTKSGTRKDRKATLSHCFEHLFPHAEGKGKNLRCLLEDAQTNGKPLIISSFPNSNM